MTAEVAILNAEAVVLAADSAVTLSLPEGRKAIPRAGKIFALSDHHPIAVMFHGNARFMGVPWETLAKEYRRLHRAELPSVEAYAQAFLQFVADTASRFSGGVFQELLRLRVEMYVRGFVDLLSATSRGEDASPKAIRRAVDQLLKAEEAKDEREKDVQEVECARVLRERYSADVEGVIENVLENLPLSQGQRTRLSAVIVARVVRGPSPLGTGLVFAGFGANQLLPAVVRQQVDLYYPGIGCRCSLDSSVEIGVEKSAVIMPFGQFDEIAAFVDGIHPLMRDSLVKKKLLGRPARSKQDPVNSLRDLSKNLFTQPILEMLWNLPKEEMAMMAETLVNLCAFRKRLSGQVETVAGPVDVAVISKGDGLVWLKRKHYFPAELNPAYFRRLGAERATS